MPAEKHSISDPRTKSPTMPADQPRRPDDVIPGTMPAERPASSDLSDEQAAPAERRLFSDSDSDHLLAMPAERHLFSDSDLAGSQPHLTIPAEQLSSSDALTTLFHCAHGPAYTTRRRDPWSNARPRSGVRAPAPAPVPPSPTARPTTQPVADEGGVRVPATAETRRMPSAARQVRQSPSEARRMPTAARTPTNVALEAQALS
jgi:hypothetical protein